MTDTDIHPRDLIAGLQKGLVLIQLFNSETPRLSVPQAARRAQMSTSSVRRFFLTLVHDGYMATDGRDYWLQPKVLRLGQAYADSAQLPRMLRPVVEQVSRTTQEHVCVGHRDGDEIIYLVRSRYSHISSMSIRPGSRAPMYCTATGRLWLAELDDAALDDYWTRNPPQALTPYTKTDLQVLREEIRMAARQGFCLVDQEYELNMRVLAVPLHGRSGRLVATLAITTHISRVSVADMQARYLGALFEAQVLLKPALD
ncbi:IclR family transcriptional regulator [Pseudomonas sp. 3A(2025)]